MARRAALFRNISPRTKAIRSITPHRQPRLISRMELSTAWSARGKLKQSTNPGAFFGSIRTRNTRSVSSQRLHKIRGRAENPAFGSFWRHAIRSAFDRAKPSDNHVFVVRGQRRLRYVRLDAWRLERSIQLLDIDPAP